MIRHVKGDLFAGGLPAIAHGCNCQGVMGAGIAARFRARWPAMFAAYRERCKINQFLPGDVMAWEPSAAGDPFVFNLATQFKIGPHAQRWMIATAVGRMVHRAQFDYGLKEIGLPMIGCGIGGLRRADLEACLAPYDDAPVSLVVFEYDPGTPDATLT